jgi:hypothetical protein
MIDELIWSDLSKKAVERSDARESSVAIETLVSLGLSRSCDMAQLYERFAVGTLFLACKTLPPGAEYREQLLDAISVNGQGALIENDSYWNSPVGMATQLAREGWGLPNVYVCVAMSTGESGYIYNTELETIYDFDLSVRDSLLENTLTPRWKSVNDFLAWYIGSSA